MALRDVSAARQVLFLTCHPHVVELARGAIPGVRVAELDGAA
jgi:uncharacterized protein YhaN